MMELKGKYELVVEVKLPDGTYTPIQNLIDFCLNDNQEVYGTLNQYLSIEYFDATGYGCLQTERNSQWIKNYFINVGVLSNVNDKILERDSLIHDLYNFRDWAIEYLNNSEKYIRDVKIDML